MSRLENGLPADDWMLLADVEAPFTEHVLEALANQGIAAYAEPFTSPESSYLGTPRASGPSDRLMVDRNFRNQARAVLSVLLPELRAEFDAQQQVDQDQSWNQIVSGLTDDGVGQNVDTNVTPDQVDSPEDSWSEFAQTTTFADDPHDHFIPPEPPPIPASNPVTQLAWAALAIGPTFLILGTLLGWGLGGFMGFLAVATSIGGGVTLIARMDDRPNTEDRGDDGAVL